MEVTTLDLGDDDTLRSVSYANKEEDLHIFSFLLY